MSARILNSAWGFQGFLPHGGVMTTPSHFSVRGRPWEVHTTTDGGVLRLLAPLEFSEDCLRRPIELPTCGRNHQTEHVMRTNRRKLVTSPLRAAIGGVVSGAGIFRVRDARLRSQCGHRKKARSAPTATIYQITDRLHEGRTVQVPCHEIVTTVSAWLA